eukprot:TRINITY_DN796_c0_g1_i1.p1 TRINITY_DN796_c0_g1~~TRINITY_DN796_c0_g1_i1.p1  ORF type:complete len:130 (+),score=60.27 TRINITY_DN796_c0_g1_i1:165-554(+)
MSDVVIEISSQEETKNIEIERAVAVPSEEQEEALKDTTNVEDVIAHADGSDNKKRERDGDDDLDKESPHDTESSEVQADQTPPKKLKTIDGEEKEDSTCTDERKENTASEATAPDDKEGEREDEHKEQD